MIKRSSDQQFWMLLPAKLFDDLFRMFPWIAFDPCDQLCPYLAESLDGIVFGKCDTGRQQRRNIFSQAPSELLQHPLFSDGAGDSISFKGEIVLETGDELIGDDRKLP